MARRIYTGGRGSSSNTVGLFGAGTSKAEPFGKIDTRELNDFYNQLHGVAKKFAASSNIMQMWSDSKGDGLFTAAGARMGILLIRSVIDGDKKISGTDWVPHSDVYRQINEELGFKRDRMWRFRSNVYKNISARRRGRGWEVGVKKNVSATSKGFRSLARYTRTRRRIPVHRYASWVEYGTSHMPARPLFSPTARHFATQVGGGLLKVVSNSIEHVANKYKIEIVKKSTATDSRAFDADVKEIEWEAKKGSGYQVRYSNQEVKKTREKVFSEVNKLAIKATGKKLDANEQWLLDHADELEIPPEGVEYDN